MTRISPAVFRRRSLRIIQIAVTVVLLVLLFRSIEWPTLSAMVVRAQWLYIGLGWLCVLISHLINVLRWRFLLQAPGVSYWRLLVYYGAGLFANNFLPTGIGGDGVRAALLSRDVSVARAVFSVGLDRAMGFASLGVIALIGLWLGLPPRFNLQSVLTVNESWLIGLILVSLMAGLAAFFLFWRSRRVRARLLIWRERLKNYSHTTSWPALLGGALGLSIISSLSIALGNWLLMQAATLSVPFHAAIWTFLLGSLSLLLPISVNGLGVMESSYVLVLAGYGVTTTSAVGVALLLRALMIVFSLLGGGVWLIGSRRPTMRSTIM